MRTITLGAGVLTFVNANGDAVGPPTHVDSFELTVEEQPDGSVVVRCKPVTISVPLNFYDRLTEAGHRETLAHARKRPAWKTPYGPQRR